MSVYFRRYACSPPLIAEKPDAQLGMIITIPCYFEPELIKTLESLAYCHPARAGAEVIVMINHGADDSEAVKAHNGATYKAALRFADTYDADHLRFRILQEELPAKHAGVGLARKMAMDEAARRLGEEGVIVCLDADSLCEDNYLLAIEHFFDRHPRCPGGSIYFEHPLQGPPDSGHYEAITAYELFLRYYVHALRYAGFPHAYQTIGSAMAVRNKVYQSQGGMNRRKAGEDFYFLNKVIALGEFGEITDTTVIPSPRQSHRVPFGTGKAVGEWLKKRELQTYNPASMEDLKGLYAGLKALKDYKSITVDKLDVAPSVLEFGKGIGLEDHLDRLKNNSGSLTAFIANFHRWFDGFKVMKYMHFARDYYYPNVPIEAACAWLFGKLDLPLPDGAKAMLPELRRRDRHQL